MRPPYRVGSAATSANHGSHLQAAVPDILEALGLRLVHREALLALTGAGRGTFCDRAHRQAASDTPLVALLRGSGPETDEARVAAIGVPAGREGSARVAPGDDAQIVTLHRQAQVVVLAVLRQRVTARETEVEHA